MNHIGKPISRVDGKAKVTGQASYAADFNAEELAHGYVIASTIAKGKIVRIDTSKALQLPGVVHIFTHENRPKLARFDFQYKDLGAPGGSPFRPLEDPIIYYSGQPIALVVAETFEQARYAASLVHVEYQQQPHQTELRANLQRARPAKGGFRPSPPKPRGNFQQAYEQAPVKVNGRYEHAPQHHNPMEPFASTVVFAAKGEKKKSRSNVRLTIYDKTQGVVNSWLYVAQVFGLPFKHVRIVSPFVGGGFGAGLRPQYQLFMAVMAALELQRSVQVVLTRQQMFSFGHRPTTVQEVSLGATDDGKLLALSHTSIGETSQFEDYTEQVVSWGGLLYPPEHVMMQQQLVPLDICTPMDMRAPGGVTGMTALEVAMDELAYELGMDPLAVRLKNYADRDHNADRPFSSKELRACYQQAAERFGWADRSHEPGSMKRGNTLVGWGMASGIWDAITLGARAEATLLVDGKLQISSATADMGTGTYTIMTQIAADALGFPLEDVAFKLGDTDYPLAPFSGGSMTASTVGIAVQAACSALGKALLKLAQKMPDSPFKGAGWDDVEFVNKHLRLKKNEAITIALQTLVDQNGGKAVRKRSGAMVDLLKNRKYTTSAHAAVFVEVTVDPSLGTITVTRAVTAVAAGKIINPKTARSQIEGGMVWGIGHALQEESVLDHGHGRFVNTNLGEYHVPVNADINELTVLFIEENDSIVNGLGVKGLGEIGVVGMPAAIANAVFHATGKRIRHFPITLDKLL